MKFKFKKNQPYQDRAVAAIVDCFQGQPKQSSILSRTREGTGESLEFADHYFGNEDFKINASQLITNIHNIQKQNGLRLSGELKETNSCEVNLDVEMETGTGKTYCYIKTLFELNERYGWNKFIIVVPSIAIREGVYKFLQITEEHFMEIYKKKLRYFIYNSKQLHALDVFSNAALNVMVINIQAFNARGKDNRRINEKLDSFQSRRPIDVISETRPILILDEPQKMEGKITLEALGRFKPLMILRYSATHRTTYNKVYCLDAVDAYNQKLVKKIEVCGITQGATGINAYLYVETIEISKKCDPIARVEMEIKQKSDIKRVICRLTMDDDLFLRSKGLKQYKGFVVVRINDRSSTIEFSNGVKLEVGEVTRNADENSLRRLQIREAIKTHLEREKQLFSLGIKVLTLFFIDRVSKYRQYTDDEEVPGEYAKIFEAEYTILVNEHKEKLNQSKGLYREYLNHLEHLGRIGVTKTHNGYFSIDKKSKRMIDPEVKKKTTEADDVDAYDLILKDKERLLSFDEPMRFIFSHSALREGWDNPNVFVICTLKHSDSIISRRQEVGRGLRIAVNKNGERQDSDPDTVHKFNVLTVVASEGYNVFVAGLQKDISESLSERARVADVAYFEGKEIKTETGVKKIDGKMARAIEHYLIRNDYIDSERYITQKYHDAVMKEQLAPLPNELIGYEKPIFELVNNVFSDNKLPEIADARGMKNSLNRNFYKKEFLELWDRINKKAIYGVDFDSSELITKCVAALDNELIISPIHFEIRRGQQTERISNETMKEGEGFKEMAVSNEMMSRATTSVVKYDLVGSLAKESLLTRRTVYEILTSIKPQKFDMFKNNPEKFILEAVRIIKEQKSAVVVEHLTYDITEKEYDKNIFTDTEIKRSSKRAIEDLERHIYDYVETDSEVETKFVKELDISDNVVVYAKLPRGFFIPTPIGNYNPDWAIAFDENKIKHVYFVAETKGSMSSLELRKIEHGKIECAKKFFEKVNQKILTKKIKYGVVSNYKNLLELVSVD